MIDHDAVTAAGDGAGSGGTEWQRSARGVASAVPVVIDGYRIERVLGEGGMGTVYRAEQRRPKRPVALKVIRPGSASPSMLRRFELETEVLGRLSHRGIAAIHAAGTVDLGAGRQPYFAMELVDGTTIDEHVRTKQLTPRAILALMAEVARAVHHAHMRGVIHRDLKPANILVNSNGQPKILDFGVARAIDADIQHVTMQTDVGQLVGTVPYMSPEQIAGDPQELDTRSDVYALGVTLYELLVGALPHDLRGRTLADAARVIRDEEITPISKHDRALRGDLETIVHTALARDRERRYASASDLASDLDAFLANEPIAARPPTALYQMSKFAARHRAPVGAAVTIFVFAIIAAIVSTIGFAEATRMRKEAEHDRTRAQEAEAEAVAINDFLVNDLLRSADPAVMQDGEYRVRDAVDRAAERVDLAFPDQPGVRLALHETIGSVYAALGRLDQAETSFAEAIELIDPADDELRERRLIIERGQALVMRDRGELDAALDAAHAVESEARAAYPAASVPVADAISDVASILVTRGEFQAAADRLGEAIPVLTDLLGPAHRRTLTARHNLATVTSNLGHLDAAERELRDILDIRRASYGEHHPDTLSTLNNLATTLSEAGAYDRAEPLLRDVIRIRTALLGPEHPTTLNSRANLTHILLTQDRRAEAEPMLRENLAIQERIHGRDHQSTLVTLNHLAYLLEDEGRIDEARAIFEDALARWRRVGGVSNSHTMIAMNNLAMLLMNNDAIDDALVQFEELVNAAATHLPPQHFYWAIFRNNHGACLTRAGRYDDAQRALEESHAVLESVLGADHERVATSAQRMADLVAARTR